ncbi:hypothetical protein ABGA94_03905, partial [Stenotrophomonas sp. 3diitr2024]
MAWIYQDPPWPPPRQPAPKQTARRSGGPFISTHPQLRGGGIKDVILPGEMKEILNGVVLAEKQAQASVIRR